MASTETRAIGDPTKLSDYQVLLRGHMSLSMTNITSTSEPTFTGTVEVNGTLVTLSSDGGTGWAVLATESYVWVYVQTTGAVVYSATEPSWDGGKGGWYNGNDRAVAWLVKDSADAYRYKHFLPTEQVGDLVFEDAIDIGDWNMDSTSEVSIDLFIPDRSRMVDVTVMIIADSGTKSMSPIGVYPDGATVEISHWMQSEVGGSAGELQIFRRGGGAYDGTSYDQTSYNRGYIRFKQRAFA